MLYKNNIIKITSLIKKKLEANIISVSQQGKGMQSTVYKVEIDKEPYVLAIKIVENKSLVESEVKFIKFISERIDIKLPIIYFYDVDDNISIIAMEYIDGRRADSKRFLFKRKKFKQAFAREIIDNLLKLQSVTNEKFGPIDNPTFLTWTDYYRPFAKGVLDFAQAEAIAGRLNPTVHEVMSIAFGSFDKIFNESVGCPVLTHGDYWMPNILVGKNMNLKAVIDPFNVMWADKEYELFALIVGRGNSLNLLDEYKSHVTTTKNCDLKIDMYALFSELYWYSITNNKSDSFILYKTRLLRKSLAKFGII